MKLIPIQRFGWRVGRCFVFYVVTVESEFKSSGFGKISAKEKYMIWIFMIVGKYSMMFVR